MGSGRLLGVSQTPFKVGCTPVKISNMPYLRNVANSLLITLYQGQVSDEEVLFLLKANSSKKPVVFVRKIRKV